MNEEFEAIERTIQEIEAISIIYDNDEEGMQNENDDSTSCHISFSILSNEDYEQMKEVVYNSQETSDLQSEDLNVSKDLTVEIRLDIRTHTGSTSIKAVSQFTLPRGYPIDSPAIVSVVSVDSLKRSQRENITSIMNEKAKLMIGAEALMDLIQDFENSIVDELNSDTNQNNDIKKSAEELETEISSTAFSRRWIWVHHITNNSRCKDIVQEANNLSLGGCLKSGYPGVVVVEGIKSSCDEFVGWIKGNKSRPGGFGRNWGHHVRGQIDDLEENKMMLSQQTKNTEGTQKFYHVGDDLKLLAAACKESGVEDEFLTYVMQH
jgi:hypothetical protein